MDTNRALRLIGKAALNAKEELPRLVAEERLFWRIIDEYTTSDLYKDSAREILDNRHAVSCVKITAKTDTVAFGEALRTAAEAEGYRTIHLPAEQRLSDGRSIFVRNNAHILSTAEIEQLTARTEGAKAKLVLIADAREGSCHRRSAFEDLADRIGWMNVPDPILKPQPQPWRHKALLALTEGNVDGAFKEYASAGRLHLADDQRAAAHALVSHWISIPYQARAREVLILGQTPAEARQLNLLAQQARRQAGEIGCLLRQRCEQDWGYRGDRVRFIASSQLGYRAGDHGTIETLGARGMTVRLDRSAWRDTPNQIDLCLNFPKLVEVPRSHSSDLTLAYARDPSGAVGLSPSKVLVLDSAAQRNPNSLILQLSKGYDDSLIFAPRAGISHDMVVSSEIQKEPPAAQASSEAQEKIRQRRGVHL